MSEMSKRAAFVYNTTIVRERYRVREQWPKVCGCCGAAWMAEDWRKLGMLATKVIAPEVRVESRSCNCGCIMVAATPNDSDVETDAA
jgi:hypothetical protein